MVKQLFKVTLFFWILAATLHASPAQSGNVEQQVLTSTPLGSLLKYRYTVEGLPFDTASGFSFGPNNWDNIYPVTKQFFLVKKSNEQLGIVWQDKGNSTIYLTWLGTDLLSSTTLNLPNSRSELLAAATYDNEGVIYYLTLQDGEDKTVSRTATLHKASSNAQELGQQVLDTSKDGLNVTKFSGKVASLLYSKGKLGLMLDRQMHTSPDGLNHHGAIAVVFDASTLQVLKNHGQTSGHSLEGNSLIINSDDQFIALDVGDNYPRGVNLHKFDATTPKKSRVVHTFKTEHGTTASYQAGQPTYPVYSEISTNGKSYYQWSNDNRTYTERAGVVEGTNGYVVVFAGEPTVDGRSLDNSRVGGNLNDPRNLGLVLVRKDFENVPDKENEISDELILTSGLVETGKFYTFGGKLSLQRNKGVVWLTDYSDKNQANVSRPKAVHLNDGNLLLLWEKWTPTSYVNTYAMKVRETGEKLTTIIELGTNVRLNRSDDVMVIGDKIYLISGDKTTRKLELIILQTPTTTSSEQGSLNTSKPILTFSNAQLTQGVAVTNTGKTTLTISKITVEGIDKADFQTTGCEGTILAPSQNCTLTITLKVPVDPSRLRSANVSIISNAGNKSIQLNSDYPALTAPIAFDKAGKSMSLTNASMTAGLSINNQAFTGGNASFSLADKALITAHITAADEHIASTSSMFIVGGYVANGSYSDCKNKDKSTFYYLLSRSGNTYCQAPRKLGTEAACQGQSQYSTAATTAGVWNGSLSTLGTLDDAKNITLTKTPVELKIWEGNFDYAGVLCVWFGYRLADGTVVISGESLNLTITP